MRTALAHGFVILPCLLSACHTPQPGAVKSATAADGERKAGCAKLVFEANKATSPSIGAAVDTDVVSWSDASCQPRTVSLARDTRGYVRQFTYQYDGKTRTASGTNVHGWNGFGFIVNHGMKDGDGTPGPTGFGPVFVGAHHAVYQYQSNVGKDIPVTRHWMFATGRDHPVFGVTFDTSKRTPPLNADTRTPYGDVAWDGDENASSTVVDGVAWGDRYKFVTTKAPLTLNSTWDYTQKNLVPYALEWRSSSDAEMGLVQTQTYLEHDAGGYWAFRTWGTTSSNQKREKDQMGQMPISWNWPYQLDQYELCYPNKESCLDSPTNSHRIAWGANYGAVGGSDANGKYDAMGEDKKLVGHPYQSYSVFVVLGKHSANVVFAQAREIEIVQTTTLTATVGTVATTGPAGVGRTDTVTLAPPGYDARYSTWNVQASNGRAAFTVTVAKDSLVDPVLVVSDFTGTAVPPITVDGAPAVADTDFFASLDTAGKKLWITFRPGWTGTRKITVG
jgi:hypothetical protein